jgi:cellulose synthase/poly-beta-1,6-N-acetylglucosamine synthase-like glycosyltransferase
VHYSLNQKPDPARPPAVAKLLTAGGPSAGALLFGLILGVLIFSLYAGFAFHGARAWLVGFIYISYDSALLLFMVGSSQRAVRRERAAPSDPTLPRPTLTVLICARNERLVLPACLDALRAQTDPPDEILILDDGSTDAMPAWLDKEFALTFHPDDPTPAPGPFDPAASTLGTTALRRSTLGRSARWPALRVLRKPNTGKPDSLNQGWQLATGEIVVTLDADTNLAPHALRAIRDAFARDPQLGIAGGVLTPVCQRTPWAGFFQFFQTFEYARGFLWRLTWMQYDMLLLISGAFAAYRRTTLAAAGGFDTSSWVEDYELTHRIYRDAYDRGERVHVEVLSGARATTDCPAAIPAFLNQRRRWFAGFIATHFQYHAMVGNGRYGPVGRYMMCIKTLDLLLPIYALASAVVLIVILAVRHGLAPIILQLIAAKLLFDLLLHAYAIVLYQRWLHIPLKRKLWLQSLGATLSEPFVFQILRQLGAVFGWLAFLRRRIDWQAQRPTN